MGSQGWRISSAETFPSLISNDLDETLRRGESVHFSLCACISAALETFHARLAQNHSCSEPKLALFSPTWQSCFNTRATNVLRVYSTVTGISLGDFCCLFSNWFFFLAYLDLVVHHLSLEKLNKKHLPTSQLWIMILMKNFSAILVTWQKTSFRNYWWKIHGKPIFRMTHLSLK